MEEVTGLKADGSATLTCSTRGGSWLETGGGADEDLTQRLCDQVVSLGSIIQDVLVSNGEVSLKLCNEEGALPWY